MKKHVIMYSVRDTGEYIEVEGESSRRFTNALEDTDCEKSSGGGQPLMYRFYPIGLRWILGG